MFVDFISRETIVKIEHGHFKKLIVHCLHRHDIFFIDLSDMAVYCVNKQYALFKTLRYKVAINNPSVETSSHRLAKLYRI